MLSFAYCILFISQNQAGVLLFNIHTTSSISGFAFVLSVAFAADFWFSVNVYVPLMYYSESETSFCFWAEISSNSAE